MSSHKKPSENNPIKELTSSEYTGGPSSAFKFFTAVDKDVSASISAIMSNSPLPSTLNQGPSGPSMSSEKYASFPLPPTITDHNAFLTVHANKAPTFNAINRPPLPSIKHISNPFITTSLPTDPRSAALPSPTTLLTTIPQHHHSSFKTAFSHANLARALLHPSTTLTTHTMLTNTPLTVHAAEYARAVRLARLAHEWSSMPMGKFISQFREVMRMLPDATTDVLMWMPLLQFLVQIRVSGGVALGREMILGILRVSVERVLGEMAEKLKGVLGEAGVVPVEMWMEIVEVAVDRDCRERGVMCVGEE